MSVFKKQPHVFNTYVFCWKKIEVDVSNFLHYLTLIQHNNEQGNFTFSFTSTIYINQLSLHSYNFYKADGWITEA